jgi:hypothetical protein
MDMDIVKTHQAQAWDGYEGKHWLRDADATAVARAREAVTAALRSFEIDGAVRLRGPSWRFSAVRGQKGL